MSLVNTYRETIRRKLGLSEEQPPVATSDSASMGGGMGDMDESTLNSVLEILQNEINKREAVGEVEGMEEPVSEPVAQPPIATEPGASVTVEAESVADDVYFEMLNTFKNNISNCEDANRKNMYRKCYEMCYKMREKFIKEMTNTEA